jgi:TorA maturation chaperone TorD
MSGAGVPLQFVPTLPPEEAARANLYGLLARLFYSPPDAALLDSIAAAGGAEADEGEVAEAWERLSRAAAQADVESVTEEYETVFVGTGKAPITLYASAYLIRYSNEAPLAVLRGQLQTLGLSRRNSVHEPEDHIAALCDVMRHLVSTKMLVDQKQFFEQWIWPTVQPLCAAIEKSERTGFYKSVGDLLLKLCMVEHMAFEML